MVGKLLSEIVRGELQPPPGNYGGCDAIVRGKLPTYGGCDAIVRGKLPEGGEVASSLDGDEIRLHESQSSPLASQPGGILLDYLRCRFADTPKTWVLLRDFFGAMTDRERGWRSWYDRSWAVLEGGIVAACCDPAKAAKQGVIVDLPGRACGSLGGSLPVFLAACTDEGENITRADFAIDDRARLLRRERIYGASAAGAIITRWQGGFSEVSCQEAGEVKSWTIYFGDREGDAMIRIYDKAAQQGVPGPWVRFELETKHDLADRLCRSYFKLGGAAIIGEINRHLRFALPVPTDSHRWRWPSLPWWAEFIESTERGPSLLPGVKPEPTAQQMERYLFDQVAPTLSGILELHQHDASYDLIGELDKSGRERRSPRILAALEAARSSGYGAGRP